MSGQIMNGRMTNVRTRTATHPAAPLPRTSLRPWGRYLVVDEGNGFRVKRICVLAGQRLSYQRHAFRAEHWYVVSGTGRVTVDGVDTTVSPGAHIDVPVGAAHRVANTGLGDLVFIEVQTGSYFGEDDIDRLCDDYGRAGGSADVA